MLMRSLKFGIFISIIFFAACQFQNAQLSEAQEQVIVQEVEEVFQNFSLAAESLEHDRYFSYFEKQKFTALSASGEALRSFDEFQELYLPQLGLIDRYNALKFDPIHITVLDSKNVVLINEYEAEVVLTSGETVLASGAGAQFWSKSSGEWKLVHVSDAVKR